jgi:hypothetical protein
MVTALRAIEVRTGRGIGAYAADARESRFGRATDVLEASSERSAPLYERLGFVHFRYLSCQKADRWFGSCVDLRQGWAEA